MVKLRGMKAKILSEKHSSESSGTMPAEPEGRIYF